MELTEENQDGMDCRPPTGRDTGIKLSEKQEQSHQESLARRQKAKTALAATE